MQGPLPLTCAIGLYDHTRDVTDGIVPVEGVALRWLNLPIEEIFYRFILHREWDVSEVSMGKYVAMRSQDDTSITALPVFVSRAFRHSMFYVREGSAVRRPEDLQGRRIGIPEWAQTAGIYGRGWLASYVGVPLASIEWVQAGVNQPGRVEKVKLRLPENVRYRQVPDRSLNEMLMAGELDAVMSARPPAALGQGVVRLMPDFQPLEERYFADTGIFPIMHSLVVQTKVLDAHPWVAMNLFKAFETAKDNALERLSEITASHAPFAWLADYHRRMQAIFGKDPYPYGCSPARGTGSAGQKLNWTTLDAFLGFAFDQGVCEKRLAPEQLFAPQVLSSFKV
jgi:4,5-dihydroxyphthalate decarboxylase